MRASLAPRLVSASLATRFATASKHGTSLSAASRHTVSDEAWNIWDALGMPRPEPGSVNVLARSADDSRPAAVKARAPLRPLDSGPVLVLFENDRVRVADFRLPPGGSFHTSHEYATVRWQVEEGQHALNGASCESVRDKQVFFLEPGESWEIRNTGDTVYRQITFELKRPPRRTEAEVAALLRSAIYSTDVGTELLLENRWCRVWDFSFLPGGGAHDFWRRTTLLEHSERARYEIRRGRGRPPPRSRLCLRICLSRPAAALEPRRIARPR